MILLKLRHIAFIGYLVTLVFIFEFSLRFLAAYGLVRIIQYPTSDARSQILADIHESFGVWRHPNRETTHTTPCFSIHYRSNSYGARDRERSLQSQGKYRVVVLGDSFVEGYGAEEESRMTNLVEESSGIEMLNFGVSGNFGTIQQWLLYRDLASKFEHDAVALFLLPDNDFIDNDEAFFPAARYRPYLRKDSSGNFELYYPVSFEERMQTGSLSAGRRFRRTLYNRIYTLNVIRQLGEVVENSKIRNRIEDLEHRFEGSTYTNYEEADLERLFFSFEQLLTLAAPKPVIVFVIPRESDFDFYARNQSFHFSLIEELKNFAQRFEQLTVVDLLPTMFQELEHRGIKDDDLFLPCDGHWSELGNEVAASIVEKHLERNRAISVELPTY